MTLRARFLAPDGTPLSGALIVRSPATLTFPAADVILGGPVTVQLDAQGAVEVTLPATDAPDMDPSGWAYVVTEQLSGIPLGRSYNVLLPRARPEVDLADIAPTDPSKPNYVGVPGPAGPQGPAGSRIYTGASAPAAGLGTDGDLYVRYETATALGVTSTTVSTWQRTAGAWAQLGGDVRGAAWYVNDSTTPTAGTRAGDMLLRIDSGNIYQRQTSASWGSVLGSLKGPKGDKGDPGAIGATGPGGVVQSVNGKSAAAVVLAAADVGAVPAAGPAVVTLPAGSSELPLVVKAEDKATTLFEIRSTGSVRVQTGNVYIDRNLRVGDATADSGGGLGVIVVKDATTVPTAAAAGAAVLYSEGGVAKIRQGDGQIVTVGASGGGAVASVNGKTGVVSLVASDVGALDQAAADARYAQTSAAVLLAGSQTISGSKTFSAVPSSSAAPTTDNHLTRKSYVDALGGGEFRASDHGLLTWAFDPALGHSAPLYPGSGPIRVTAVYLRSAASVTKIAWHFGGYAGGLASGSWAALYNASGTRVAQTADLSTAGAEPAEVHNTGGATVSVPLTAAYSAPAGLYFVAWRFQYNTSTGDGPMMLVAESSFGSPPNVFGLTPVRRFGSYATGAATAPASLTLASMENGSNRFWTALA
ncbi:MULTISPECIES: hypothetical protein [unclassified Streptomyces]|uniref:hypothetical protein n=1 Tax=unclassified Streptomyces TaxID=2593676 RepID=UPI0006AF0E05|nr:MULTISPECIES: hypothetical protein [unclassified Streptomyces]